jgi:hypothetical protein
VSDTDWKPRIRFSKKSSILSSKEYFARHIQNSQEKYGGPVSRQRSKYETSEYIAGVGILFIKTPSVFYPSLSQITFYFLSIKKDNVILRFSFSE